MRRYAGGMVELPPRQLALRAARPETSMGRLQAWPEIETPVGMWVEKRGETMEAQATCCPLPTKGGCAELRLATGVNLLPPGAEARATPSRRLRLVMRLAALHRRRT